MTTPSEPEPAAPERRLHPVSWLFVLIEQISQFALPLIILLFTGSRDDSGPGNYQTYVGVTVLVLYSIGQYFTYRFRIDGDGLTIRSGVFQKTVRHIPFNRIHNVALHQSLLHRLFDVAEVRLESAGGAKPEGQMRVLSIRDAQALEALVRGRAAQAHAAGAATPAEPARTLLALDTADVVRVGLVSNRGLVVVFATLATLMQTSSAAFTRIIESWTQMVLGWTRELHLSTAGTVIGVASLAVVALVALRAFSVLLALLQFHGFVLSAEGSRLRVERGLLSRLRGSVPRRRIQAFSISEGIVHRWVRRQSLVVDSAASEATDGKRSLRDLAPVATPARLVEILAHLVPQLTWPVTDWRALHPRAWRRQLARPAILTLIAVGVLVWRVGNVGLFGLALLPLLIVRARVWARHAAYAETQGIIAVREGWLDRSWRFAEVRKLQSLALTQSPFDRRHGMLTLWLDTAGASRREPPLRIRYLPAAEARALHARLTLAMDARA